MQKNEPSSKKKRQIIGSDLQRSEIIMAILKCKMCGGNIEPIEGQHYGTCDSCGNTMTLPDASEEKIVNLFNRANHYRMQSEFDKALATYENILIEAPHNAEAHWGCVLSKFGVEYVEDPKTHRHIPTLHRVQKESVLVDLEYKAALANADYSARELYEKEAAQIEAIQKKILSVANSEAPYDIFICYKESDTYGKRTMDSVLAQDIYQQLCGEGYRVFFSRITLEDKIGVEYEPYIFSALNSAKIMLVVGTKPEYFNSVWVKNEWARFLALAKNDSSRLLIPCYRDMDAYELPEALAIFQSQDMSRIGFIQDLKHGIQKILKQDTTQNTVAYVNVHEDEGVLLQKGENFLEIGNFAEAKKYFHKVFEINPHNAAAHWGCLLCRLSIRKTEEIANQLIKIEQIAGNLTNIQNTGVPYKDYVGTEDYRANMKCDTPSLGIFDEYKNAVKFATEEQRQIYIQQNKLLIQQRNDLYEKNLKIEEETKNKVNTFISDTKNTKSFTSVFIVICMIITFVCLLLVFLSEL
jgi:tetratricopeptide (TPR) repeat protein